MRAQPDARGWKSRSLQLPDLDQDQGFGDLDCVSKSIEVPSDEKGFKLQQVAARQRGKARSLRTSGLWRCLVLLLVLALSTPGVVHAAMGDHAASAASLSHIASVDQGATGEPHCAGDSDETHGAACCTASVCSFCVPLTSSTLLIKAVAAEVVAALLDDVHIGRAPSPGFRPPSLSTNV